MSIERNVFMNEKDKVVYTSEFVPYVIKWGRRTNLIGIVLLFVPCAVLAAKGILPLWGALGAAMVMRLSSIAMYYFVEPVTYYAGLGLAGSYMAFLSGNINNMRVPCALNAQEAANVEIGSPEGNCIATIGIAVSIVVNLVVLTLTIVFGTAIVNSLSADMRSTLNYLIPALFGSLVMGLILKNRKFAYVSLGFAAILTCAKKWGLLAFLPSVLQTPVVMLAAVFGSVAIGLAFFQDKNENKME